MRPTNAVVVERNLSIWALFGPLAFATLAIVSSILGIKLKFLNDATLLSSALLAYFAALVLQLGYVLQREELLMRVASFITVLGFAAHSAAFALHSVELGRPPFGGINEVMVSFSWAIVLISLIVEKSAGFKLVNLIALPLAAIALFLTILLPGERSGFLVPALRSYWLYIHVSLAMFSYSALAVSFAIAVLYLVKDGVGPESFGLPVMGMVLGVYLAVGKSSIVTEAAYGLNALENGREVLASPDLPLRITIPGVGPILLAAFVFSLLAFVAYLAFRIRGRESYSRLAYRLVGLSFLFQMAGIAGLIYKIPGTPRVGFSSNPFELTGLISALILTMLLYVFAWKREKLVALLPDKAWLEELTYKTVTWAFPLLTLMIIAGAVWAEQAWGRYWGWDPKETWALITWLIYAGYLHARAYHSWMGRRAAYLAIAGFACVIFTYLGVTYLLSGLHSYK